MNGNGGSAATVTTTASAGSTAATAAALYRQSLQQVNSANSAAGAGQTNNSSTPSGFTPPAIAVAQPLQNGNGYYSLSLFDHFCPVKRNGKYFAEKWSE